MLYGYAHLGNHGPASSALCVNNHLKRTKSWVTNCAFIASRQSTHLSPSAVCNTPGCKDSRLACSRLFFSPRSRQLNRPHHFISSIFNQRSPTKWSNGSHVVGLWVLHPACRQPFPRSVAKRALEAGKMLCWSKTTRSILFELPVRRAVCAGEKAKGS